MTLEQEFNERFKNMLSSTEFEFQSMLGPYWYGHAITAYSYTSPIGLGISPEEYEDLYLKLNRRERLNCYDFALLNNNVEARTSRELEMNLDDYVKFQKDVGLAARTWKEQTDTMRQELLDELNEKYKNSSLGKQPNLRKALGRHR